MHCSSCIWLLENLNKLNPNIIHSSVNFVRKELAVKYLNEKISLRDIVILITSIGYETQISLESVERKSTVKSNKSLYYKIGIAGFALAT